MNTQSPENRLLSEGLLPKESRKPAKPNWIGRMVIFAALSIGSVAGCIVLLRNTVHLVSASPSKVKPVDVTKASRGVENEKEFLARERRNEVFLAEAMQEESAFIRDRQHRVWVDQTRQVPDHRDAYAKWKTQVERLENKIAETSQQRGFFDDEGNVIPQSILWHQQQRLEKLRNDSPDSY
ncbi:hypothetical protein [Rhodopirellula bahusiensis]|uniref:hypothetical protein n=1 Tax=Rhodopirellula bahusiensis TaxID=2014065 RepID=UPI003265C2CE